MESLSPDQIRGMIDEIAAFPASAKERGRSYAMHDRVGPLLFQPGRIGARVRGTRLYDVWWTWEDQIWDYTCTCPMRFACKHQYAVACCILEPLRTISQQVDRRLARLLPARAARHARLLGQPDPAKLDQRAQARAPASKEDPGDQEYEWPVAPRARPSRPDAWRPDRHAPPPAKAGSHAAAALEKLRTARDTWSRTAALQRLLAENPRASIPLFAAPFDEILEEQDFEILCLRLARAIPAWTGGWIPPALEPYRDRKDLVERHVRSEQEALADRLTDWSAERTATPERRLRFVLGLEPGKDGLPVLTLEVRLTSRRLDDQQRTVEQLQQLLREAERRPGRLAPEQMGLLDVYLANLGGWPGMTRGGEVTTTTARRLLETDGGTEAVVWDEELDPELASLGGIRGGDPVRLAPQPVSIVPACEPHEGGLLLDLHVRWHDGRTRRLEQTVLLRGTEDGNRRHSSMIVCEGHVHLVAEQPPDEITGRFLAAGGLPLERGTHADLIEQMAGRFASMRDSLAPYTRVHAVAPMVTIDLRDDDWMQIRLFAVARDLEWTPMAPARRGSRVHEYRPPGHWGPYASGVSSRKSPAFEPAADESTTTSGEQPSAAASEVADTVEPGPVATDSARTEDPIWLERLDDDAVAPAVEWLARTGAGDGVKGMPGGLIASASDRNIGWWLRFSPQRAATFAAAWEERPRGVRWYCTPRAKRLLGNVHPVRPRLRVKSSGVDWFNVSAEWEAEGMTLTDEDLAALRRASGPFVKISSGWVRRESGELVEHAAETLADLGIEPGAGEQRLSLWQLAQARPESLGAFEALGIDGEAIDAIRRLRERVAAFEGLPRVPVPTGLRGTLRPYQREGLDFLAYTATLGLGAVLADDMGLGKTVQALAWLLWLRHETPDLGPVLVVCPASVVHNWAREAAAFTPELRVALLTSGGRRRALLGEAASHDLLVTNYALLRRDIEAWREMRLGAVILDEAQNIKNPDAVVSRATLTLPARHRLALTGTPLENRALDLWSIMAFLNPGLLGGRLAFTTRFDRADAPAHVRRLLAARLRPVLLRRMKREVAKELPERIEERRDCEMHPAQRRLYLAELGRIRAMIEGIALDPQGLGRHRFEILAGLTRLRQICCHPALAGGPPTVGSGKFDALWEILDPLLAEGHKVLVFSQFVQCLDLLKNEMVERGIAHHMLTGQTQKREEVVAAFQADERPAAFLISLRAGGTGLNLTAASYVVLFDPWWNPAVEAQAIDRTHRIGQTRTVIAYRMLTQGTVEEKIWELQQRKAALARDVLGEDGFARTLTRDDLEYLLAPE